MQHRREHGPTFAFERMDPPRRLTSTITDPSLPFGGSWEYALTPAGTGSRLVVTEYGEVSNPIFRFVSHFFMSNTATLDAFLAALGRQLGGMTPPADAAPVPRAVTERAR